MWGRKRGRDRAVTGFEVPAVACPACGHRMNVAAPMSGTAAPRAGDIFVCDGCGALLRYTEAMSLEALPEAAFNALPDGSKGLLREIQRVVHKHSGVMVA